MLKLGRVTKGKVLYLVLVFVFNFDLFKFSATILEKGLLMSGIWQTDAGVEILIWCVAATIASQSFTILEAEMLPSTSKISLIFADSLKFERKSTNSLFCEEDRYVQQNQNKKSSKNYTYVKHRASAYYFEVKYNK